MFTHRALHARETAAVQRVCIQTFKLLMRAARKTDDITLLAAVGASEVFWVVAADGDVNDPDGPLSWRWLRHWKTSSR
jgi:hypothetical protein